MLLLLTAHPGLMAHSGAPAMDTPPGIRGADLDALRVLVMSRTEGFRHASIIDGLALIASLAAAHGWTLQTTEEASDFNATFLADFDVIVFLSTTGDILDPPEEQALRDWVETGGGWVGIHAAADTEHDWPWYGTLLGGGAWFVSHPQIQDADLDVDLQHQASTACFASAFTFRDEWYNFASNPRDAGVEVLLTIDESSYDPGANAMGADHPIAWRHAVGMGRAWYTNLGHRSQTFADTGFREHLTGGMLWAAGADFADGFESGDRCRWAP